MFASVGNKLVVGGYRGATAVLRPLVPLYLSQRVKKGKEDRTRLAERYGRATLSRPPGPLIWAHGASVGETLSILPLLGRLGGRGFNLLVTTGTVTSARLAAQRLPPGVLHQFLPLDFAAFVSRFHEHWRPDLALFAESELWPNLIFETARRKTPIILVNGRMSDDSFRRWGRLSFVSRAILSRIDLCLAQSRDDAHRYEALGAPRVATTGNLKFDTPPPSADRQMLADLQQRLAGRQVVLAASTHRGEEAAMFAAHRVLAGRHPQLLTIVAPRHPERGPEVVAAAESEGLRVRRRSIGEQPDGDADVYVADTMGELGLFYRLAPIVFVGGSLVRHGGQNPIEPAKLECAILHGPHVFNFTEVYATLNQARGAATVADGNSLARSLAVLLDSPDTVKRLALAAAEAVSQYTGSLDRTLAALDPYLIQLRLRGG